MKRTLEILGATMPAGTPVAQAANTALAKVAPSAPPAAPAKNPPKQWFVESALPGLAGAIAGAFLWEDHRVLGFFGGGALGANVMPIVKGTNGLYDRRTALCAVGAVGVGVGASLGWRKHPVLGYLGGGIGAAVALRVAGVDKGGAA
jgi:hypothetical protein